MSSYHKPKIYRSLDGCCICKAKSSSSRFTDSQKYESEFSKCFRLEESREGDICNACVLIVKRWRRLPKDTKKDWAHVVDARHGPGNKQTNKQKKKEDQIEMFEKIRKKRKNKKSIKMQRAEISTGVAVKQNTASNTFDVPDFIDLSYWKRSVICCGVIYRGECGEVMVDQRYFGRCSPHTEPRSPQMEPDMEDVTAPEVFTYDDTKGYDPDSDTLSLYSDTDSNVSKLSNIENAATIDTIDTIDIMDTDGDEGFFDKSDIRHFI